MEVKEFPTRISQFHNQLCELLSRDALSIHDIIREKPSQFDVEGVYVISTPDDEKIVYVGKTRTKSVIGRLSDHRIMDTNSDLKGMLKLFPDYPQETDQYLARCIKVTDPRKRTYFEHFLISILQPPFNK